MSVKILLVEDNLDHAMLFELLIDQLPIEVELKTHTDADGALEYLKDLSNSPGDKLIPQIIFVDLKLPGRDGFSLLEDIKNIDATRSVPIYVLSSSSLDEDVQRAKDFGVSDYLLKPLVASQLGEILNQLESQ